MSKENSLRNLKNQILIKSKSAFLYTDLALYYKANSRFIPAEMALKIAISCQPDFLKAYMALFHILKDKGEHKHALTLMKKLLVIKDNSELAYLNIGGLLFSDNKFNEAEKYTRKAISINYNLEGAHYNLARILEAQGELEEAEKELLVTIRLNINFAKAYYILSTYKNPKIERTFLDYLFSDDIIKNISLSDRIDINFARSNILHSKKDFEKSSQYLFEANELKRKVFRFDIDEYIETSLNVINSSSKIFQSSVRNEFELKHIFIVGMPRCGSTLVESILSMNRRTIALGEVNYLEDAIKEYDKDKIFKKDDLLQKLYSKRILSNLNSPLVSLDKQLYNYLYSYYIITQIPNAKIISCHRNPLDNILSIYRANFTTDNLYSNSIIDCAKVLKNQRIIMNKLESKMPDRIYSLNYDHLVKSSDKQIQNLISWLGWEWNESYLSPHLSMREIATASSSQVRYPINEESLAGWLNYQKLLKPAIELFDLN